VVVDVEATDGRRVRGYAGDNLAPKWFDKDPSKSFRDNVKDELAAIRIAHQDYLEAAKVPRSVFQIWLDAFAECRRLGPGLHLNPLTVSFGSSFFERALADAAARLAGADVVACPRHWRTASGRTGCGISRSRWASRAASCAWARSACPATGAPPSRICRP